MLKLIKALFSALKWGLVPTCDNEAGVHICGQGRRCTANDKVIEKDEIKIERFEND
jgi:hypothetical protein